MKTLLTMALVLLMAGTAFAQLENSMGVFFSDTEFTEANTNFDAAMNVPFAAHIVLMNPTQAAIGGYECSLAVSSSLLALSVGGPNGWTNFGDNFNHLVGYTSPLPSPGDVVFATFSLMYMVDGIASDMFMGPSVPSSVDDAGPAIADGANPDLLIVCNYTSGPDMGGIVATLHGDGIEFPGGVATENQSWSGVKSLFE